MLSEESPRTAIGLALDRRLRSGTCTAVSKHSGRSPSRSATAEPPRGGLKDYCLLDELGECLGTIAATRIRPVLGNNAPTLYLRRERDVGAPHTQIHGGDEAEHRARLQRALGEVYRLGELIRRGGSAPFTRPTTSSSCAMSPSRRSGTISSLPTLYSSV